MGKRKRNCSICERNQAPIAVIHEKRKKCSEVVYFFKKIIVKQFVCECEQMRQSGCVQWICFMWKARKEMGIAGKYGGKKAWWMKQRQNALFLLLLIEILPPYNFYINWVKAESGIFKSFKWRIKCILLAWFIFMPLKMSLKKTPFLHVIRWLGI